MCMYIYIYRERYVYIICILCLSLSLSLYMYIYIYIYLYTYTCKGVHALPELGWRADRRPQADHGRGSLYPYIILCYYYVDYYHA